MTNEQNAYANQGAQKASGVIAMNRPKLNNPGMQVQKLANNRSLYGKTAAKQLILSILPAIPKIPSLCIILLLWFAIAEKCWGEYFSTKRAAKSIPQGE